MNGDIAVSVFCFIFVTQTMRDMSNEGYIYLGELYDVMGRPMDINDKKIGLSINPIQRENQLNNTKSLLIRMKIRNYCYH